MSLNVLLIGGGGREHALAWSIAKSDELNRLYIAPGNPGTAECGTNVLLDVNDHEAVLHFIEEYHIDLTVVGPEQPLVDGLADYLEDREHKVFGPRRKAAMLEGSKEFAKDFMKKYDIPTAAYKVFDQSEFDQAAAYLKSRNQYPVVLKADGLAAGKGVLICEDESEALIGLDTLKTGALAGAAQRLVIEEFMKGEEASVFAICDGDDYLIIGNAQDHKRVGEGDTGLNTGGMGAYSPTPLITADLLKEIERDIIKPTIEGMKKEGHPYAGVLYVGLMITEAGPKVVEYNCRFGDPECQVILPRLKSDLLFLMNEAAHKRFYRNEVELSGEYFCTVVLVSGGYPGSYEKGKKITGLDDVDELIFHAGTRAEGDEIVTNGGRVLNVVGSGLSLREAIDRTYREVPKIYFDKAYYRNDIGAKGLKRLE
jgi:phosphoribosylamine--glycine ligase